MTGGIIREFHGMVTRHASRAVFVHVARFTLACGSTRFRRIRCCAVPKPVAGCKQLACIGRVCRVFDPPRALIAGIAHVTEGTHGASLVHWANRPSFVAHAFPVHAFAVLARVWAFVVHRYIEDCKAQAKGFTGAKAVVIKTTTKIIIDFSDHHVNELKGVILTVPDSKSKSRRLSIVALLIRVNWKQKYCWLHQRRIRRICIFRRQFHAFIHCRVVWIWVHSRRELAILECTIPALAVPHPFRFPTIDYAKVVIANAILVVIVTIAMVIVAIAMVVIVIGTLSRKKPAMESWNYLRMAWWRG